MTIPDNGKKLPDFYPMVGLHSGHEVVKLMEVEPWTPLDPNAVRLNLSVLDVIESVKLCVLISHKDCVLIGRKGCVF